MKKLILIVPVVLAIVFILSCDKIGNSKKETCVEDETQTKVEIAYPWLEPHFNMQVDPDDSRVFQVYSDVYENICPDEHIYVEIHGSISPIPLDRDIRFRIEYRYGAFGVWGNTFDATFTPNQQENKLEYSGGTTFGIKDAYGAEPGSFYVNFEWYFKGDNGEETADLAIFKQYTVNFRIWLEYYNYDN
jgi:hypothetical protein